MSLEIQNLVRDRAPCVGSVFNVLLALAELADDDGKCSPSIELLSNYCRVSTGIINQSIKMLALYHFRGTSADLITVSEKEKPRVYEINVALLKSLPKFEVKGLPQGAPAEME
jgi:hypothetical protein